MTLTTSDNGQAVFTYECAWWPFYSYFRIAYTVLVAIFLFIVLCKFDTMFNEPSKKVCVMRGFFSSVDFNIHAFPLSCQFRDDLQYSSHRSGFCFVALLALIGTGMDSYSLDKSNTQCSAFNARICIRTCFTFSHSVLWGPREGIFVCTRMNI